MPLVVMCGIPKSGKTSKAIKIKDYFEKCHKKRAVIVSEKEAIEKAGFDNELFLDSQKEKHIRGVLKSEVSRLIGKEDIVILDSGNYIKGFRYELYCLSKAAKTTQCTVYCITDISEARARAAADGDGTAVFDALVARFEEPNCQHRWDRPLTVWGAGREEGRPLEELQSGLFHRAPPPPNLSTQNAPLSDSVFLQQVDGGTRAVCELAARGLVPELAHAPPPPAALLARLRRQFLTYTKQNLSSTDPGTVSALFTQYLITNLNV